MKNKLLLKEKRRTKRKICLGMLNINIWKSGRTEKKKSGVGGSPRKMSIQK